MPDRTYRAHVGDRTFDVVVRNGALLVDGEEVRVSIETLSDGCYSMLVDGRSVPLVIDPSPGDALRVTIGGRARDVQIQDERALLLERFGLAKMDGAAVLEVHAPMPGLVLRVLVEPGQVVKTGDGLVVLEAMKMENELRAHADGIVKAVHARPGDAVGKNALLVAFE